MIYAFDDVGESSYLYVLAFVQALVGDAPYGVHVSTPRATSSARWLLYRLVRPASAAGARWRAWRCCCSCRACSCWSISALKEPLYMLVARGELVVRGADRPGAAVVATASLASAGVVVGAVALESLRRRRTA